MHFISLKLKAGVQVCRFPAVASCAKYCASAGRSAHVRQAAHRRALVAAQCASHALGVEGALACVDYSPFSLIRFTAADRCACWHVCQQLQRDRVCRKCEVNQVNNSQMHVLHETKFCFHLALDTHSIPVTLRLLLCCCLHLRQLLQRACNATHSCRHCA